MEPSHHRSTHECDGQPADGSAPLLVPPGYIYAELRKVVFLVAGLFLAYQLAGPISTVLLLFLMVFIISAVLNPVVSWLHARGLPRMVSAIGLIGLLAGTLVLLAWLVVPPFLGELGNAMKRMDLAQFTITGYYKQLLGRYPQLQGQLPPPEEVLRRITPTVGTLLGHLGGYAASLVSGVVSLLLLVVLVVYTVGQPSPLVAGMLAALPERHREPAERILSRCLGQLKTWALGSLLLGAIVGTAAGIGLYLLGVPYAGVLGLIAGIGELLPTIGPILSAVPPVLLALTVDPMLALWVVLFYVVLQQVENNAIVPMVFGNTLQLHPVSIVFALLAMNALLGLLGAILAVPVATIVKVCWEELYLRPRSTDPQALETEAESVVNHAV